MVDRYDVELIDKHLPMLTDLPTPQPFDFTDPPETIREQCTTYRVLRDTKLARDIKILYEYRCQICGDTLTFPNGEFYCEVHHIKPLGKPHSGPDIKENILCVCPNHHVMVDYGAVRLNSSQFEDLKHEINEEYIDYHNRVIWMC